MGNNLYWVVQTLGYWGLVFLMIPLTTFKKLFAFGFIGGFLYTWLVQYMAVDVFHRWIFTNDIFMILNIPVFFVLSWTGVIFVFGYLLLRFPKHQIIWVIIFAISATFMNYSGIYYQMIKLKGWGLLDTFMFGVFSHVWILYFLKIFYKKAEIGAPLPK
jgi:hypothetical protein